MFLNTFVQKLINSKYSFLYHSCVGFFSVVCFVKCYLPHPSSVIHAAAWCSGQISKPVHLY